MSWLLPTSSAMLSALRQEVGFLIKCALCPGPDPASLNFIWYRCLGLLNIAPRTLPLSGLGPFYIPLSLSLSLPPEFLYPRRWVNLLMMLCLMAFDQMEECDWT